MVLNAVLMVVDSSMHLQKILLLQSQLCSIVPRPPRTVSPIDDICFVWHFDLWFPCPSQFCIDDFWQV